MFAYKQNISGTIYSFKKKKLAELVASTSRNQVCLGDSGEETFLNALKL